MKTIKELIMKNKAIITYMFFGICTTLINWLSYYLCYNILYISNVLSTIIAWVLAVVFAFIANKKWVFDSKSYKTKTLLIEISTFFMSRFATGVLDVIIMWVTVDLNDLNSTTWKLLSNAVVIVLNYVLSKFVVFRKRES